MRNLTTALALIAAPLTAQVPEVILRTTTRLVQINVIVARHGAPVTGLKKEDFQVFDNGKPQEIRQFSEETRAMLAAAAGPLPPGTFTNQLQQRSATPAAVTAILLDGVNTTFADQSYARQQVIRFLKQIRPEDRVAVYTLDWRGLRVLHDYTRDSADLVAKLANYAGEIVPDVTGTSGVNDMLDGWLRTLGADAERAYSLNHRIELTLSAIGFIANNLATLPGRKNLIWVSAAFPLQIGFPTPSGAAGVHGGTPIDVQSATPGMPGMSGRSGFPRMPREQRTWTTETDRAVRALNNANLAIYPVDARGLVASAQAAPHAYVNQAAMEELAGRTGGRVFANTNDIGGAIRTAVQDSAVTYTLGFYPQNDKFDNSFHTLKVKLVDSPHCDLRYRRAAIWTRPRLHRMKSCAGPPWLTRS